jgi:beta-glucanase (GH16 family)
MSWLFILGGIFIGLVGPLGAEEKARSLVWSDEFDQDGTPDPKKWGYEEGFVRNGEKQYYTRERRENVRVENGNLVIEARKEKFQGAEYTAGSLQTAGKFEFCYGRVEVRAQIPQGRGIWPAIWLLGSNIKTVGWPRCGEIDLMEFVGFDPEHLHFTFHTQKYNHLTKNGLATTVTIREPWRDFHLYALDWTPGSLVLSLDGKEVHRYDKKETAEEFWPYDHGMFLILNVAVGGSWGGLKGIDDAIFPQEMKVDSVRIYRNHALNERP